MTSKEHLIFDLERLLQLSTWEKSYLSPREIAKLIFWTRDDASKIAEEINEIEKQPEEVEHRGTNI